MSRLLTILLLIVALPAQADIYGYTDDHGTLVLSDVAQDARYVLLLKTEVARDPGLNFGRAGTPINFRNQQTLLPLVEAVARAHGLEAALLHAVISVESGYEPRAVSPKGAIGLMQVMPATGRRYGAVALTDPAVNLHAGARYLRDLIALFQGDLALALAAYNAGEHAVLRHGGRVPPYRETQQYVPRVLALYERFRSKG